MSELKSIAAILGRFCSPVTIDRKAIEQQRADLLNSRPGSLNLNDGYDCPLCKNRGYIAQVVEDRDGYPSVKMPDCKCQKVRRSIILMRNSGLENQIKKCRFDNFQTESPWQEQIKSSAMEYAANPAGWFFFGGQSGCGKTHICTAICREVLYQGKSVRYMLWRDEIPKLKALSNDEGREGHIGQFKKTDLLYIDDLFKTGAVNGEAQQPTSADINIAFEVLNYRYINGLPTVISSECELSQIVDIDEATGGRITEMSRGHAISLRPDKSRNWRLRGA